MLEFPAKRVIGQACIVSADIFKEGHDQLAALFAIGPPAKGNGRTSPCLQSLADRWAGAFLLDRVGEWRFRSRRDGCVRDLALGLEKKVAAGQTFASSCSKGAIVERASRACKDRGARGR